MNRRYACFVYSLVVALLGVPVAMGETMQKSAMPRPEHPMPQLERAEWLNLNGTWEFGETDNSVDSDWLSGRAYPDKIVVPFCRESKLSGLARTGFIKNVWYRRTFQKPADWKSPRVRLHIGACDWKTRVWVNGLLAGEHVGGSAPFSFDITDLLKSGDNVLIVHAFDDTRSGLQAGGKQAQSEKSEGCSYTRTTGIWQTVWLEGVGSTFLSDVRVESDIKQSRAILQAEVDGPCDGVTLKAVALADGKEVGAAETTADWRNNRLVVNLSNRHLWSVKDPFLYELKLTLLRNGQVIDEVNSYFGLREVTIHGAAILINGEPVFQRTVLDQGFYPEGIWTAPSDEALKNDIKLSQNVGFNGARLHQKVFEPRFLYWADKLGYLVWGEFPNWGLDHGKLEINLPIIDEWVEILRRDRNHPAVIGWCPFNETTMSAGPIQNTVLGITRAIDPSRPVVESSGWSHCGTIADVWDVHDYDQNPASYRDRWQKAFHGYAYDKDFHNGAVGPVGPPRSMPFFVSEFGGIGWNISGGWGYGHAPTKLEEFYARFKGLADALLDNRQTFGYCYTQLTDIEQEQNGLYYYDRKPKFDVKRLHAIQSREAAYEKDPPVTAQFKTPTPAKWQSLIPLTVKGTPAAPWYYTTEKPAKEWADPAFDACGWKQGNGGFGDKAGLESRIGTPWKTSDIWLRRQFTCDSSAVFRTAKLLIQHDDDAEVYLNGKQIWKAEKWNDQYAPVDLTQAVKDAIRQGQNVLAIHCHQDKGGQFIDAALLIDQQQ